MKAEHFSSDIQEFIDLLSRSGVRYLLVGGEAVIYHGYARLTGDVDFFYDRSPSNCRRLFSALEAFWCGEVPGVDRASELEAAGLILQFGRPPNRNDLLSTLGSTDFARAWARKTTEPFVRADSAEDIHIIGLRELIESKREAGRHKDLDDIEHLPSPDGS